MIAADFTERGLPVRHRGTDIFFHVYRRERDWLGFWIIFIGFNWF